MIYDDPFVSIESIKKIKVLNKVNVLLAAWDEPRTGSSIDKVLQDGVEYIQRLYNTVIEVVKAAPTIEVDVICKRVLESLNLPLFMAIPLVARSLTSSIRYMEDGL